MSARQKEVRRQAATTDDESGAASARRLAEAREGAAPPVETGAIAAWVNEGGAGGEVDR
jgi:hypothetical protein